LDFQIPEILAAGNVWKAEMHQHAKFYQNWSIGCGDIAVYSFFKMAAGGHLEFLNSGYLNGLHRLEVPAASTCQISSKSVKWLRRFCEFSILRPLSWTTHEAYLVVVTGVQNLVGIHAVVLIM